MRQAERQDTFIARLGVRRDESARDAALCACLAFYTQDPAQVERLVTRSGCRREKWDARPDCRHRTISFALAGAI